MIEPHPDFESLAELLEYLAEDVAIYVEGWMDEKSINEPIKLLLNSDMQRTWESLYAKAQDFDSFGEFFYRTVDSEFRYWQITKKTHKEKTAELADVVKCTQRLIQSIKRLEYGGTFASRDLYLHMNAKLKCKAKRKFTPEEELVRQEIYPSIDGGISLIPLLEISIISAQRELDNPDRRLSNKTGRAGLLAFYTNSLCAITSKHFSRPCYGEIATIANVVLKTDENRPITEENVRMNFKNYSARLAADKL